MYEEFCVAACRFFIRQACVSDIRGLIVTPFNSELIYRHLDVPLLSVGDATPAAIWATTAPLRQSRQAGPGHNYQILAYHQRSTR